MNDEIGELSIEQSDAVGDPQPNLESLQCNGQVILGSGVSTLKRVEENLRFGKWTIMPASVFTGPGDNNWKAQGRESELRGVAGHFVYQTGDDARIHIHFYVPYSGNNDAYIYAVGKDKDKYECAVTPVPKSGSSISPVYIINRKNQQTLEADHDDVSAQPNAGNRICEGETKVGKGVNLSLLSQELKHGKWDVNPASTITGPYDGTFMARGRDATALGAEGTVRYKADDDATFSLDFNVPYAQSNSAGIRCEGADCKLYSYSVSPVPESGHKIQPAYTITRK